MVDERWWFCAWSVWQQALAAASAIRAHSVRQLTWRLTIQCPSSVRRPTYVAYLVVACLMNCLRSTVHSIDCSTGHAEYIDHNSATRCAKTMRGRGLVDYNGAGVSIPLTQNDKANPRKRGNRGYFMRLLQSTGLKIELGSYCSLALFPLVAALRLLVFRRPGKDPAAHFAVPGPLTHRVFSALIASERHLLRWLRLKSRVSISTSSRAT